MPPFFWKLHGHARRARDVVARLRSGSRALLRRVLSDSMKGPIAAGFGHILLMSEVLCVPASQHLQMMRPTKNDKRADKNQRSCWICFRSCD